MTEVKTIADLDALDAEFEKNRQAMQALEDEPDEVEDAEVDETQEDEVETDDDSESEDADEQSDEDEETETKEETDSKPVKRTKEEKEEHAWKKMREKISSAKEEAEKAKQALAEKDALINNLMKGAGYEKYDEFKTALEQQLSAKEMKEKGYTQEQYDEIAKLRKENEQLKAVTQGQAQQSYQQKAVTFDQLVQKYSKDAGTTAKIVYDQLSSEGYTVETLLAEPKPELLLKGLLADKLALKQNPAPKKNVDTKAHHSGSAPTQTMTIDDLVNSDLAEYKKRRGG